MLAAEAYLRSQLRGSWGWPLRRKVALALAVPLLLAATFGVERFVREPGSTLIHQDASLYAALMDGSEMVVHQPAAARPGPAPCFDPPTNSAEYSRSGTPFQIPAPWRRGRS